tara:strand:- start:195 stop:581 length:387 start_codon:yes stop_codon:yes gene_type:complete
MPTIFERIFPWFGNTAEPTTKKVNAMSKYTNPMIDAVRSAAPLNLAKAHSLANSDLFAKADVGYRSIIAKAKSLGVEYVKAAPAARSAKEQQPTKAHYLAQIRKSLALPEREGDLTKIELVSVLESIG